MASHPSSKLQRNSFTFDISLGGKDEAVELQQLTASYSDMTGNCTPRPIPGI